MANWELSDLPPRLQKQATRQLVKRAPKPAITESRDCGKSEFKVVLPLPSKYVSPNGSHYHWASVAKSKKAYREMAAAQAGLERMTIKDFKPFAKPCVRLHAFYTSNRRRDADNLIASLKSGFDGLTDAGIWTDDHLITHLPPVMAVDKTNPRIEIVVTES